MRTAIDGALPAPAGGAPDGSCHAGGGAAPLRSPSRAPRFSYVTLPPAPRPYPGILDFLDLRFPHVGRGVWEGRLDRGDMSDDAGRPLTPSSAYRPHLRLRYRREVDNEPPIPGDEEIVFRNEHLLVACKPHFVPVTPSGPWVNQCLLYRLCRRTGLDGLAPAHRLDRETAGLVLFCVNPRTRGAYASLFAEGRVRRLYEAIATLPAELPAGDRVVESRIEPGEPWFRSRNAAGQPNARTRLRLCETRGRLGRFEIEPFTGKHHQIRLHLAMLGCGILNDPYYPTLQAGPKTGFDAPMQLVARELEFTDPVSGAPMRLRSGRLLAWPP